MARFCRRELRGGNHFGLCTPAVAWNGDRRARYLCNPRDLIFAYTGLQRSRLAARSGVHATAEINGDIVTIHGVRNFDYCTETDFTQRWEVRTYDLRKLDSADIIAAYWMGKSIAHVMLSFGFAGKDYLAVSIETRKERGESYSTLAGFFRNYELYYVIADERDVIRVRTNYRPPQEDVFIYRSQRTP